MSCPFGKWSRPVPHSPTGVRGPGFGIGKSGFRVITCPLVTTAGPTTRTPNALGASGFGFRFRDPGLDFRVSGFGFRFSGLGFRVSVSGFRVSESGSSDPGFGSQGDHPETRNPHFYLILARVSG